jgi:hypothetical protein
LTKPERATIASNPKAPQRSFVENDLGLSLRVIPQRWAHFYLKETGQLRVE